MTVRTAPPVDPEATRLLEPRATEPPTVHIAGPAPDQPTRPIALPRTVFLAPRRPRLPMRPVPARPRPPAQGTAAKRAPIVQPRRLRLPFGTLLAVVLLATAMGGASSAGLRGHLATTSPAPPAAVSGAPLPPG